jgi:hypothetical protein
MRCSNLTTRMPSRPRSHFLKEPIFGSLPHVVGPRPAFGCNAVVSAAHQRCHLYFARRMTFLSCADTFETGQRPAPRHTCYQNRQDWINAGTSVMTHSAD